MIFTYVALIGMSVFCDAIFMDDVIDWNIYKHKFSKSYNTFEEDVHHMVIWLEHKHKIEAHNQQYENGIASFRMGLNKYSDMKHDDFVSQMNGYRSFEDDEDEDDEGAFDFVETNYAHLPAAIDWREKGAVTNVKDQRHCGSCWSFATTGAIESQYFRKTGRLLSLSEQNLIDCSQLSGNHGCHGGLTTKAFQYVIENGGIKTEHDYPYVGYEGYCKGHKNNSGAMIHGFVAIPFGDEDKLKAAIATVGPVSVSIDASHPSFHHYSSGIYYDEHCSSTYTNHAVLVVGYGTDEHERDYYIVKNSWGTSWGENGYFRLIRNHRNHCGIAKRASYPVV